MNDEEVKIIKEIQSSLGEYFKLTEKRFSNIEAEIQELLSLDVKIFEFNKEHIKADNELRKKHIFITGQVSKILITLVNAIPGFLFILLLLIFRSEVVKLLYWIGAVVANQWYRLSFSWQDRIWELLLIFLGVFVDRKFFRKK